MYARDSYFENTISKQMYNVAIYLRLSKEDEITGQSKGIKDEKTEKSESINNQKEYITKFVIEQNWNIIDYYIDDGYTGLNFNRPDFKRMICDIENRKVNLVITKDLSRLGRDYIDTGYYIERYFPQKNIRYIALNDGIDTCQNTSNNDMSPFKAVINDMYAKDISKKVRSVMDSKRFDGQFIGAFAPYGYKKDPNNKNNLIIDEDVAYIVLRIFNDFLSGNSLRGIARELNNEGVPCPTKYKELTSTYKCANIKRYLWNMETIKRIVTNPTYCGNMAQHRQEKINYKVDKFKKISRENWIVVENTHEPLISKEKFELAQRLISKKINHNIRDKAPHLLNGLVFCKDCGQKMTFRRNCSGKMIMLCMTYSKYGKTLCSTHTVNEAKAEKYVIDDLKKISKHILNDRFYEQFSEIKPSKNEDYIKNEIDKIQKRLDEIKNIIKSLYEDKVKKILAEDLFISMSSEYNSEKETLTKRYQDLLKENEDLKEDKENNYIDIIKNIANFDEIDRNILMILIEKIEITQDRKIEITYRFKNPYESIQTVDNIEQNKLSEGVTL